MLKAYFKLALSTRILLWMFIGSIAGIIFGEKILFIKPIGDIFLQLLLMSAIPLVFFNLLAGISSIGSVKSFGKVGAKIIVYYLFTTSVAITIGLVVMGITKAGEGMSLTGEIPNQLGEMPEFGAVIMNMVPSNIFASFAEGNLIQTFPPAKLLNAIEKTQARRDKLVAKGQDVVAAESTIENMQRQLDLNDQALQFKRENPDWKDLQNKRNPRKPCP